MMLILASAVILRGCNSFIKELKGFSVYFFLNQLVPLQQTVLSSASWVATQRLICTHMDNSLLSHLHLHLSHIDKCTPCQLGLNSKDIRTKCEQCREGLRSVGLFMLRFTLGLKFGM